MNKLVVLLDRRIQIRRSVLNILLGVFVILLNLYLLVVGVGKHIDVGYGNSYGITPRTFPIFIFSTAIILAVFVITRGIREFMKRREDEERVEFYLISAAIFVAIIFFISCIKILGYPLTNIIMMFSMYYFSGGRTWWKGAILSLLFTIVSTLFFYTYLKLSIPLGVLEFLFF